MNQLYNFIAAGKDIVISFLAKILRKFKQIEDKKVYSFEYENNGIELLKVKTHELEHLEDLSDDIKNNIINYLEHHFYDENKDFYVNVFETPIYVEFKYNNEIYEIALNSIMHKRSDNKDTVKQPKVLLAIANDGNTEKNVTDIIRKYHGPNYNFYENMKDAVTDLSNLHYFKDIKELHILNMIGKKLHLI